MKPISRRRWLMEALALAALPRALGALPPDEELVDFADCGQFMPDLQAANPRVKCFDLRRLSGPITPTAEFFVFHQTTVPQIDIGKWKLEIGGFVERPATFTMAELAGSSTPMRASGRPLGASSEATSTAPSLSRRPGPPVSARSP